MSVPQAFVRSPTEGERYRVGPFEIMARVLGDQTGGTLELYELALGPATIDYHVHHAMDETLTVLEGEIEFGVAGQKFPRSAGSVAFVPRGVHHGFANLGPAKARVLILFSPSGGQHELPEIGAAVHRSHAGHGGPASAPTAIRSGTGQSAGALRGPGIVLPGLPAASGRREDLHVTQRGRIMDANVLEGVRDDVHSHGTANEEMSPL
jgi:quercetin dioxygenase-like cupin family protein